MFRAMIRLVLISIGSLILIFFGVVLVRTMGLQQTFAAPPHPWFDEARWEVYAPPKICEQNGQITDSKPGDKILITTHFKDGNWILDCADKNIPLQDTLANSRLRDWVINIKAIEAVRLDSLVDLLSAFDKDKKFALASPSHRVIRFMRKKGPQWLFAADSSTMLRMQVFTSLWIETAMDFWPDFVLATPELEVPAHLSPRLAQELTRRAKRIIWDETRVSEKPDFPIQGIVTNRSGE